MEAEENRNKTMNSGADGKWISLMINEYNAIAEKAHLRRRPPTIPPVPHIIRRCDESAYVPEILAIGPYHRRSHRVQKMEKIKWLYLQDFCSRSRGWCVDDFLLAVLKLELEEPARRFYSEDIDMDKEELLQMLVLDGCYIVELFLKSQDRRSEKVGKKHKEADPIFGPGLDWVLRCVARDLLLAENQLPFLVLKKIFDSFAKDLTPSSLSFLAMSFFEGLYLFISRLNPSAKYDEKAASVPEEFELLHLLHLVHFHFVPAQPTAKTKKGFLLSSDSLLPSFKRQNTSQENRLQPHAPLQTVPRAQRLQDSGIRFKKGKGKNFLDIKFEEGVMEIPHLVVDQFTNTFLRNLIAFEQSCPTSYSKCFTMYAAFMDFLVNTAQDVEILHQHGILDHGLGSEKFIASLFNDICKGLIVEPDDEDKNYMALVADVLLYCDTPWNAWRAKLNRDYFSSPWAIVSLTAAVVALTLTFINTFFGIYRYYHASP